MPIIFNVLDDSQALAATLVICLFRTIGQEMYFHNKGKQGTLLLKD